MSRENFTPEQEEYARTLETMWLRGYSVKVLQLFKDKASALRCFMQVTEGIPLPDDRTRWGCIGPALLDDLNHQPLRSWLEQQPKPYAAFMAKKPVERPWF